MTDEERAEVLELMARIEAKVDHVLKQLDGLLAVCERLEGATVARSLDDGGPGERTVH